MIWKTYYQRLGDHVHCRLFCGPQKGALGKCGDIVFRHEEFAEFTKVHRVLAMTFVRETDMEGKLLGEDYVIFDRGVGLGRDLPYYTGTVADREAK